MPQILLNALAFGLKRWLKFVYEIGFLKFSQ